MRDQSLDILVFLTHAQSSVALFIRHQRLFFDPALHVCIRCQSWGISSHSSELNHLPFSDENPFRRLLQVRSRSALFFCYLMVFAVFWTCDFKCFLLGKLHQNLSVSWAEVKQERASNGSTAAYRSC
jgi:hypothetical protein